MGNFSTIVFDLDGVLFRGDQPVAGAGEVLRVLAAAGVELRFATNNATGLAEEVAAAINRRTGFPASAGDVVTSGMATAAYLAGSVDAAYVVGATSLVTTLERGGVVTTEDWRAADAVVVGLDRGLTYRRLADATRAVRGGARLVATNSDPTFPAADGLLPGAGAIVAAVETATGAAAEVCGKPHDPMARLLGARVGHGPVLVVGDRIDTDIELGRRLGWATALVLTGVATAAEAAGEEVDHVLGSVAEIPGVVGVSPS